MTQDKNAQRRCKTYQQQIYRRGAEATTAADAAGEIYHRQKLNKALKDGKILQAGPEHADGGGKKDYEATPEKAETVRREGVCGRSSGRQCSCCPADASAELRTLEKHAEANVNQPAAPGFVEGRKSVRGTGGGGTTSPAVRTGEIPAGA